MHIHSRGRSGLQGGTSLSKAYQAIQRFSEDVDVTYDIRRLLDVDSEIPRSDSQARKWTSEVHEKLPGWIGTEILPRLKLALAHVDPTGEVRQDDNGENVIIAYTPLELGGSGYVGAQVLLEFGARSSGEPADRVDICCDAQGHPPEIEYPRASPRVMDSARTFWEKATAVHVYCVSGRFRGGRGFARHWYDLVQLWDTEHGARAASHAEIRGVVAAHKSRFFRKKDRDGHHVDYGAVVSGHLHLVPDAEAFAQLRNDYAAMVDDGMFITEAPSFDEIIDRCAAMQEKLNQT